MTAPWRNRNDSRASATWHLPAAGPSNSRADRTLLTFGTCRWKKRLPQLGAQPLQCELQFPEIHWLRKTHVKTAVVATPLIRREVGADGNRDDARIILSDLRNEFIAIAILETDIAKNHIHLVSI